MKKPALKRGRLQGNKQRVRGGPWDAELVFIPQGGTMVFRVGPFHGSYSSVGAWKDV